MGQVIMDSDGYVILDYVLSINGERTELSADKYSEMLGELQKEELYADKTYVRISGVLDSIQITLAEE